MAQENDRIVFRWHFLIIYLLIAAVISYALVDFKTDRGGQSEPTASETHGKVIVTTESDSGFDVDDDSESEFTPPGTIQEFESLDEESAADKEDPNTSRENEPSGTTAAKTTTPKTTAPRTTTAPVSTTAKDPETTTATSTEAEKTTEAPSEVSTTDL